MPIGGADIALHLGTAVILYGVTLIDERDREVVRST